jgi:hypothetical protein
MAQKFWKEPDHPGFQYPLQWKGKKVLPSNCFVYSRLFRFMRSQEKKGGEKRGKGKTSLTMEKERKKNLRGFTRIQTLISLSSCLLLKNLDSRLSFSLSLFLSFSLSLSLCLFLSLFVSHVLSPTMYVSISLPFLVLSFSLLCLSLSLSLSFFLCLSLFVSHSLFECVSTVALSNTK